MEGRVAEIVQFAWNDLPPEHRALLEAIGCDQWKVVETPLGQEIDALRISAGLPGLSPTELHGYNRTLGIWDPALRLMLINVAHRAFEGLDDEWLERALAWIAWHEWGHALSIHRATDADVAAGERLLEQAPDGIAENVRSGDYRARAITHELVAEIYATLMARRRRGHGGKPEWLTDNLWSLVRRATEWTE
jgi:hypothetical protein